MNTTEILNRIDCGLSRLIGTGLKYCKFNFNDFSNGAILLFKKGVAIPSVLTQTALVALQKSGDLIVIRGIVDFEFLPEENQYKTYTSGIKVLARKGLFEFKMMFTNGTMYNRVLKTLEGFDNYETALMDSAGNVLVRTDVDGNARGYSTGHVTLESPVLTQGAETESQSLLFQFTNRNQFDSNVAYLEAEKLEAVGVDFTDLRGANQLAITLNAPSDTDTTLTGSIRNYMDGAPLDTTLLANDFLVNNVAPSAITINTDGTFSATIPAVSSGDVVTMRTNGIVSNTADVLYQSNTASVSVQ